MHTTGIIHHFGHSNIYMDTSFNHISTYARSPCFEFPLLVPFPTYLAPSSCDRNRPPRSQVACELLSFVPHCSLVPSPPKSQPFWDFPEPNVHLIKAHLKPSSQCPEQLLTPFRIRWTIPLSYVVLCFMHLFVKC
jgi:hypothetical protein